MGKNYIKLSDSVYEAIKALKDFNYKNIYDKAYTREEKEHLKEMLNILFINYLNDLNINNEESNIVKSYLKNMDESYKNNNTKQRIVIDYIAGMTDDYALKEYNKIVNNNHTNFRGEL